MSSPGNNNDKPLPAVPQEDRAPRRRGSVYTQSNAAPIRPRATSFGNQGQSTFYSFPRLPEEPPSPARQDRPSGRPRNGRTASISERIALGIRSLLGSGPSAAEKKPLLSMSLEEYETGKQQKTEDGAHVFCQHVVNEACQCTVTMPIAAGRNMCQTCSDGQCAAASKENNPNQELKCRHLWDDKCQCTRFALWVTGDEFCGPCWYGQCQGEKSTRLKE